MSYELALALVDEIKGSLEDIKNIRAKIQDSRNFNISLGEHLNVSLKNLSEHVVNMNKYLISAIESAIELERYLNATNSYTNGAIVGSAAALKGDISIKN